MIGIVSGTILKMKKPVTYEEWNDVTPGISIEKLETEIGKPENVLMETQEMLDAVNADRAGMEDIMYDMPYLSDNWR